MPPIFKLVVDNSKKDQPSDVVKRIALAVIYGQKKPKAE